MAGQGKAIGALVGSTLGAIGAVVGALGGPPIRLSHRKRGDVTSTTGIPVPLCCFCRRSVCGLCQRFTPPQRAKAANGLWPAGLRRIASQPDGGVYRGN